MVSLFGLQRCLQFTATEVLGTQHLIDWGLEDDFPFGKVVAGGSHGLRL